MQHTFATKTSLFRRKHIFCAQSRNSYVVFVVDNIL